MSKIKTKIKQLIQAILTLTWRIITMLFKVLATIINIPFALINRILNNLNYHYRKDTIYILIIMNMIVWSTTYVYAGNFWQSYKSFLTENEQVKIIKSVKAQTKVKKTVKSSTIREVTAYNVGDYNQCAGNPCISANGENICEALKLGYKRCAANFVPFGTRLEIEHYGICIVTDRLNSRYKNRVDIAMKLSEKQRALKFGKQNLKVSILN